MLRALLCSSSVGQNCDIQHLVSSNFRWSPGAQIERGLCTGRPPIVVMIQETVWYNFDLLAHCHCSLSSLNMCTGRPLINVMVPDAV